MWMVEAEFGSSVAMMWQDTGKCRYPAIRFMAAGLCARVCSWGRKLGDAEFKNLLEIEFLLLIEPKRMHGKGRGPSIGGLSGFGQRRWKETWEVSPDTQEGPKLGQSGLVEPTWMSRYNMSEKNRWKISQYKGEARTGKRRSLRESSEDTPDPSRQVAKERRERKEGFITRKSSHRSQSEHSQAERINGSCHGHSR